MNTLRTGKRRLKLTLMAAAAAATTGSASIASAGLIFDNASNFENGVSGAGITATGSAPNTFMGDGYNLASGATDITGLDIYPVNLAGTTYNALKINFYIWGTVNTTGTVSATAPAFSNLLGSYSLTTTGNFSSGVYFPFESTTPGVLPGIGFASPLVLTGSTVGLTFNYQGSTDGGTTFSSVNNLTSLIAYGTAPTVGSQVFDGYYRNANSETNGNFTSALRTLGNPDESLAVRIYGDFTGTTLQWNSSAGGNWEDTTRWNPNQVPSGSDTATFNLSSTGYTVALNSPADTCQTLNVENDHVTLALASSASAALSVVGTLTVGQLPTNTSTGTVGFLAFTKTGLGANVNVTASSVVVGPTGGVGTLSIGNGVQFLVENNMSVGALSTVVVKPGGLLFNNNLILAGTTDAWTGKLDLTTGYTDIPGATLATVTNQIKQGYNLTGGANWNGSGGITSSTAAADTAHLTALGVIQNNQGGSAIYGNPDSSTLPAFGLFAPDPGDILIKYTYFGDANLDGKVDGSDYSLIDNGYASNQPGFAGTVLSGWYNGDFNYDGVVDGSDYTLIDNAFNNQGSAAVLSFSAISTAQVAGPTAVPEPASLGIAGAALAAGGLRSKRRRQSRRSE